MPKCTILVGVPGSGKSTWMLDQEYIEDQYVASTDAIIEQIAGGFNMTYNEGFKNLITFAEQVMWKELGVFAKDRERIYVDRTNLTAKSRQKFITALKPYGYEIECVVFPLPGTEKLPSDEWGRRLESRPGKTIPGYILSSMIEHYEPPTEAEGFSKITII